MKWILLMGVLFTGAAGAGEPRWRTAEPGWKYEWPRDHGAHREFKTEWWYFTGGLQTADGRRFGYELTFFRSGLRPPGSPPVKSRFVAEDLKIAHFALTDVKGGKFAFAQKISRGAFGEAGFGDGKTEPRLAWLDDWSLTLENDGAFRIAAQADGREVKLTLTPTKPMVPHGKDGISRKSETPGHASHYYSATRLRTAGTVAAGDEVWPVSGESWFDHEWATSQLAPGQTGWDWFSIQFEDGAELMIYRLRRRDGTVDPASSGTWIAADGTTRHLRRDELKLTPQRTWTSAKSGGRYPIAWQVEVPALLLQVEVTTPVEAQELTLDPVTYWEGLIDVAGARAGQRIRGHGYLELTGYAGELVGLSEVELK